MPILSGMLVAAALYSCGPDDFSGRGEGTAVSSAVSSTAGPEESPAPSPESSLPESAEDSSVPASSSDSHPDSSQEENDFDLTVSGPFCSDHLSLLDMLVKNGHMPEEFWWINDQAAREAFPNTQYLSAGCGDKLLNFDFQFTYDEEDIPSQYGMTQEEMSNREMKVWPWHNWFSLANDFEFFVTLLPEDELPEITRWMPREGMTGVGEPDPGRFERMVAVAGPYDENGNLMPTPEPTPFPTDRQPVEEYQPPEWRPVPEHEGYEMAIVAETDDGSPLSVRLRWQRDGYWFQGQIPGHCLDKFWEISDSLWVKMNLSDYAGYDAEQEPQRGTE